MSTEVSGETLDPPRYRFDEFVLDVPDRQLWRGEARIDLNARYFDALALLIRERGHLVEKDRFFDEVWSDVVVSNSALTQCIKEIRKQLDDDASDPRYIQTVPRHGYRFIGTAEPLERKETGSAGPLPEEHTEAAGVAPDGYGEAVPRWRDSLREWGAGTLGGGLAGLIGGLLYGFGLASAHAGVGTLSTLLVLVSLNVLVGLTGGFGVSTGLAGGGLFVGALAKLLGVDAFNLLVGRAPAGITGGPEGAALGAALAVGAYAGARLGGPRWYAAAGAGLICAVAGALIPLAGGRLMGGSLDLLAQSFAESRLRLDRFGPLFGELHFGRATEVALGGIEGLLFGGCVVGALILANSLDRGPSRPWRL